MLLAESLLLGVVVEAQLVFPLVPHALVIVSLLCALIRNKTSDPDGISWYFYHHICCRLVRLISAV